MHKANWEFYVYVSGNKQGQLFFLLLLWYV